MKRAESNKNWNFFYTLVFIALASLVVFFFSRTEINFGEIQVYDLFLMFLATYRLTRLLIYDEILNYIKGYFVRHENGDESIHGFVKSTRYLLSCPWCLSMWMGLISICVYMLVPYGKLFIIVLSLSAMSNLFHLVISLLGWVSDEKKIVTKTLEKKTEET